jgi:hypothetical protein
VWANGDVLANVLSCFALLVRLSWVRVSAVVTCRGGAKRADGGNIDVPQGRGGGDGGRAKYARQPSARASLSRE